MCSVGASFAVRPLAGFLLLFWYHSQPPHLQEVNYQRICSRTLYEVLFRFKPSQLSQKSLANVNQPESFFNCRLFLKNEILAWLPHLKSNIDSWTQPSFGAGTTLKRAILTCNLLHIAWHFWPSYSFKTSTIGLAAALGQLLCPPRETPHRYHHEWRLLAVPSGRRSANATLKISAKVFPGKSFFIASKVL